MPFKAVLGDYEEYNTKKQRPLRKLSEVAVHIVVATPARQPLQIWHHLICPTIFIGQYCDLENHRLLKSYIEI